MKHIINQLFCDIVLDNFIVTYPNINLFFFIQTEYSFLKKKIIYILNIENGINTYYMHNSYT
jgi:hypothetical protein